jgi:hypothetical protein
MIRTQAELRAALSKCQGGETIDEGLEIREPVYVAGLSFSRPVTIKGGSIEAPSLAGEADTILRVDRSTGLHFEGIRIRGTVTPDRGWLGRNLFLDVHNMALRNCDVQHVTRGIQVARGREISIVENDFHNIRSDGVNFTAVSDGEIKRNWYRTFRPIGNDHADLIQFWSTGQTADCHRIVIEDECGDGDALHRAQGLLLSDAIVGHTEIVLRRLLLANTMWHAATVEDCPGVTLEGVRVLSEQGGQIVPGGPVVPWISLPADAIVRDISAPRFLRRRADGTTAYDAPAGGVAIGTSIKGDIEAEVASWRNKFRPNAAAPAPAPVPAPAPMPTPAPSPAPAPAPAPPPPPIDRAEAQRLAREARAIMNEAENAMGRAMRRMDKLDALMASG